MHPVPPHNEQKKNLPYIIFLIKNFNKKMAVRVFFFKCYGFRIIIKNSGETAYTRVERFFAKRCAEILMHKGSRKPQAYPRICREFLRILDAQEIGAVRVKNRSIQVIVT
jgi:hypothetical protein